MTGRLGQGRRWRNELFGLTREPAAIIYNRRLVPEDQAPLSRYALLDALARDPGRYRGKVATYDIGRSGVGYVMAFSDSLRSSTFGRLVQAFRSVGAEATCCSAEIIDGVARGRWLVAYNVLGSYALRRAEAEPDLRIVLPQDYTLLLGLDREKRRRMLSDWTAGAAEAEWSR
ncbi:ABC transporter substrate-binding protein [Paracoccus contaminans]|uniref:Uncharacterized protein n=1 Tax=Paracoccus contaminans TaxID=1945662 RepID=A0A1W6D1J4_9RHOB|nr:hypothetical protein [Paracoccus contaminans]ARJ70983.1 hypothetical protein B0A89_14220 [Paracoccus contaminans]